MGVTLRLLSRVNFRLSSVCSIVDTGRHNRRPLCYPDTLLTVIISASDTPRRSYTAVTECHRCHSLSCTPAPTLSQVLARVTWPTSSDTRTTISRRFCGMFQQYLVQEPILHSQWRGILVFTLRSLTVRIRQGNFGLFKLLIWIRVRGLF